MRDLRSISNRSSYNLYRKKTKSIDQFLTEDKTYTGRIKLGATTPSFDLETNVDKTYPVPEIDDKLICDLKKNFKAV